MKKALVIGAVVAALSALTPTAASATPGNSTNYREDGYQTCYYYWAVYKNYRATC